MWITFVCVDNFFHPAYIPLQLNTLWGLGEVRRLWKTFRNVWENNPLKIFLLGDECVYVPHYD
jgi:hypothetical protein